MKPTDEFNAMNFKIDRLVSNIQQQFTKLIGGLLLLTMVWQGVILGVDVAVAAPLLGTSNDRVSEQVADKASQIKDSVKEEIGKAQTPIQDRPGEVTDKVNHGLNYTKDAVDRNQDRAENNADNIADKVKNFFGK
ncbi:hypothetical protein [Chamaesiphon polymorphus]|uniref:CsbD family protein n=1 Tax=Chamaesiphon polymorphus CCALA 037 TaxID=2107692 RepID=A0A2T1F706_9CYAN|nr:hypothetical protein [Chamaesiphon polymorphus]PSB40783.1 hypothetical protein C7B77_27995 [Chamaesiphon polymorphus CCALA 037]